MISTHIIPYIGPVANLYRTSKTARDILTGSCWELLDNEHVPGGLEVLAYYRVLDVTEGFVGDNLLFTCGITVGDIRSHVRHILTKESSSHADSCWTILDAISRIPESEHRQELEEEYDDNIKLYGDPKEELLCGYYKITGYLTHWGYTSGYEHLCPTWCSCIDEDLLSLIKGLYEYVDKALTAPN